MNYKLQVKAKGETTWRNWSEPYDSYGEAVVRILTSFIHPSSALTSRMTLKSPTGSKIRYRLVLDSNDASID